MLKRRRFLAVVLALVLTPTASVLRSQSQDHPDLDAIDKIRDEALQRSQVMEVTSYLADVYGPRLTGSPNIAKAGDWAVRKMTEWGLADARLEPWGPFGRGWTNERFVALAVGPQPYPLIAYPKAWTPGTNGPVTAEAVLAVIQADKDFRIYRGELRGKFVLTAPVATVAPLFDPLGHRYTDAELLALSERTNSSRGGGPRGAFQEQAEFGRRRAKFFVDEGVVALLEPSRGGSGDAVFVGSGGSRDLDSPPVAPQVVVAVEQYNRIARTLEKKIPVTLELNIQNRFYDADLNSFTAVAEIPGTDKADEIVMLGAHFDSWHSGTGATDNAAGSAVMMEAMRILKATGLKMRRTVRIGLWTGEEQGLLGSRAYVKEHFADRDTMELAPEHAKFSAYFNLDNGTGKIRGIYLQGNEGVAPIFESWMDPFRSMGMTTLTRRGTGGTDHASFDAVGLPGFQFIQDPIEYETRTHHSNIDVYDRIQPTDMMENAAIVASFAYHTANRDARLPRKPLPAPRPPAGG